MPVPIGIAVWELTGDRLKSAINVAAMQPHLLRHRPCRTIFVRARTVAYIVSYTAGANDLILGGPTCVGSVSEPRRTSKISKYRHMDTAMLSRSPGEPGTLRPHLCNSTQ